MKVYTTILLAAIAVQVSLGEAMNDYSPAVQPPEKHDDSTVDTSKDDHPESVDGQHDTGGNSGLENVPVPCPPTTDVGGDESKKPDEASITPPSTGTPLPDSQPVSPLPAVTPLPDSQPVSPLPAVTPLPDGIQTVSPPYPEIQSGYPTIPQQDDVYSTTPSPTPPSTPEVIPTAENPPVTIPIAGTPVTIPNAGTPVPMPTGESQPDVPVLGNDPNQGYTPDPAVDGDQSTQQPPNGGEGYTSPDANDPSPGQDGQVDPCPSLPYDYPVDPNGVAPSGPAILVDGTTPDGTVPDNTGGATSPAILVDGTTQPYGTMPENHDVTSDPAILVDGTTPDGTVPDNTGEATSPAILVDGTTQPYGTMPNNPNGVGGDNSAIPTSDPCPPLTYEYVQDGSQSNEGGGGTDVVPQPTGLQPDTTQLQPGTPQPESYSPPDTTQPDLNTPPDTKSNVDGDSSVDPNDPHGGQVSPCPDSNHGGLPTPFDPLAATSVNPDRIGQTPAGSNSGAAFASSPADPNTVNGDSSTSGVTTTGDYPTGSLRFLRA